MSLRTLLCASPPRLVLLWGLAAWGLEAAALTAPSVNGQSQDVILRDGFETQHPVVVIINEIMQNPSAVLDSAGEWFELYNAGADSVDINGWTIADAGIDSHPINNGGPLLIPAGGYLVLGNNADMNTNGGVAVDYSYGGSIALGNADDEVILTDTAKTVVDRVDYDGGAAFPDPDGASMALIDPTLNNDSGANWCVANTPYGNGDLGTPGSANDCDIEFAPIVINEIMQNPSAVADAAGEWVELYNPGAGSVDINGWTIGDASASHLINNGGPLLIPAGGYLVLGNNADMNTNGGVAVDYSYAAIALGNNGDSVILLDAALGEVDQVDYDGGAFFPDPDGASMSLVDPALDNNVGSNWCVASTPFGNGDLGTPGFPNDCVLRSTLILDVMPVPDGLPGLAAVARLVP